MAARGGKGGASAGGDNSVSVLVDGIRKHKKFKQLASYNIQCLEKPLNKSNNRHGWEAAARTAFELGAVDDIADVCARFATDSEVFKPCITCLTSLTAVPKCMASIMAPSSSAASLIVTAVGSYFSGIDLSTSSASALSDSLSALNPALSLLLSMARYDGSGFDRAGGIALLLSMASSDARPKQPAGLLTGSASSSTAAGYYKALDAYAGFVAACTNILDRASRSKGGLDALHNRAHVDRLLKLSALNLQPVSSDGSSSGSAASASGGASSGSAGLPRARSMRGSMLPDSGSSGSGSTRAGPPGANNDFNVHLAPAFRILDRLARGDAGRELLLAAGATSLLSPIMPVVLRNPAVATLAMRVLARLLGSNVTELIARIAGTAVGGGKSPDLRERVLCARLLAFMLRDEEYVGAVMAGEGAPLLRRIIELLGAEPLASSPEAAAALVQVLRRLGEYDTENIPLLEEFGALAVVAKTLQEKASSAEVASECIGFFAAIIDCNEMVQLLATGASGTASDSTLQLALTAALPHSGDSGAALNTLALMERSMFYEFASESLVAMGAIPYVLRAMKQQPHDMQVQLQATELLIGLASCSSHVDSMVSGGVAELVIRNLGVSVADAAEPTTATGTTSGAAARGGAASGGGGGASSSSHHSRMSTSSSIAGGAGADAEDEDSGRSGAGGREQQALSASLVASSLYLVTSLCAVERHIAAAKSAGIIKAVLLGFSRHTQDPNVYKNFREVISALNIEETEVTAAIGEVSTWTGITQAGYEEPEAFKSVDDYVSRHSSYDLESVFRPPTTKTIDMLPAASIPRTPKGEIDIHAAAERVLEALALLEAVTVSPVFVCVMSVHDGVAALLRVLGVFSSLRTLTKAEAASGRAAGGSTGAASRAAVSAGFGAQQKGLSSSLMDEVLSRACNTLAHLARVSYEIAGGHVEQDPEYEPLDFDDFSIGSQVHEKDCNTMISRALSLCAKPQLRAFASAAITLVSWLASGHNTSDVASNVEGVIAAQGIEGCVSMLRAHQGSIDISSAIAGALTRIAVAPRGATAVATRGGSRQITRMLHATAALRSNAGDELLLAYLRLMDTIAAGGPESADILRRQGLIDAVVACTDAGTDRDFRGDDEDMEVGVASSSSSNANKSGSSASGGKGGSSGDAGGSGGHAADFYQPDPVVRGQIDETITSLLSRLITADMVRETVTTVQRTVKELAAQVDNTSAPYDARKPLRLADYQRAAVVRSVVRLGLLAGTEAGVAAGRDVLEAGALACNALANLALKVKKSTADLSAAGGAAGANSGSLEQELEVVLPASIRSVRQLVNAVYLAGSSSAGGDDAAAATGDSVGRIAIASLPTLFRVLDEEAQFSSEAVSTAAVLAADEKAAASIIAASGGRGLTLLVDALRAAADRGDEATVRDCLSTIACIAKNPAHLRAVLSSGALAIAQAYLSDNINEAAPETLSACFSVLAYGSADPAVLDDLVRNGRIFEAMRSAVNAHCNDPYNPREPLLHAIAMIMQRLGTAPAVVSDAAAGEDFRNALKRLLRAAACSTGYIDAPRCSAAVLNAVTDACSASERVPAALAALNREAALACSAEDLIVQCMSSYAATQEVLDAGYAALQSIGASERAAAIVEQIDSYAATIPDWLTQGYSCQEPQVIDMVVAMGDLMRSLASQIVVSRGRVPELGTPYSEVLATTWRAVAVACREDVVSQRQSTAAPQAVGEMGKDLHQARADVLAVGAQIAGRLESASQVAAAAEGSEGPHAVPLGDLVSVLYTILAATHSVLEVRVVESLGRAAEQVVEHLGEAGLHSLCTGKVIAGFVSLLQVVHSETTRTRLAAAGTMGGEIDTGLLSLQDLSKCEAAIGTTIRNIVGRARAALGASKAATAGALLSDAEAMHDVMSALAITTAPASAVHGGGSSGDDDEGGEEDPDDGDASEVVGVTATSGELQQFAEAVAAAAFRASADGAAAFAILHHASQGVVSTMQGPARHAPAGKAPLYTVTTLQSSVRVQNAMLKAIMARVVPIGADLRKANIAGSLPRAQAVTLCFEGALDVAIDVGRKLRAKVVTIGADASKDTPDDESDAYLGSEAEQTSAKTAFAVAASVASSTLRSSLELLAAVDHSSPVEAASSAIQTPSFAQGLAVVLGHRDTILNQQGLGKVAVQAVSRLSDLYHPDVQTAKPLAFAPRTARVQALGADAGVYRSAVNLLPALYAAENPDQPAISKRNLEHVEAVVTMVSDLLKIPGVDIRSLGLDKQSLLALNATLRKYNDTDAISKRVTGIISALESIYQEQSGAAFESTLKSAMAAVKAQTTHIRHSTPEGKVYYEAKGGGASATTWSAPPAVATMVKALLSVDTMARRLEEEAVTLVSPEVIAGMIETMKAHKHDPGVTGVMLNALGKLAANADNHPAILKYRALESAVEIFRNQKHISDPRVCEGLAAVILPLSFEHELVRSLLTVTDVIPLLIGIIKRYNKHCTTFIGSPMAWLAPEDAEHNAALAIFKADGVDAEDRNKSLPRLAQMCVQSLANLACDNEPDDAGVSSVTRIVTHGGVEALGELMSLHIDNPRLLEDSICALSNMAFVSDTIQLSIGRNCMDTVCTAATNFNADSYLFQMTLRAIGNLTRCDENIMRAVGFGVIKGMVDGMQKHAHDPAVLQLCADVIGNMASVDDKKVGREEGVRILMESSARRRALGPTAPPSGGAASGGAGATPASPAPPPGARPPSTPRPPTAPRPPLLSPEALMSVVEKAKSLKEAVCTVLYEDGAPRALVEAMTKHFRNADLAGSCLRALHYIGASPELVHRMVEELALVDQVVYIMRSIDYRPDVLRRGARVLGLVVGTDTLKDKVLQAGAPVMLLQAIETHKSERELCISCYSVLAMARSSSVVTAVQEMQAVDTAVTILRQNSNDHEFVGVLLELLWGWAAEAELATTIATRAGPTLISLLQTYATNRTIADRLQHQNYILNLMIALVRQRVDPTLLTTTGIVSAMDIVVDAIIGAMDGAIMLQQRSLVMQCVTIMMEISKPQPKDKDVPPVISQPGVDALVTANAGPLLERILTSYKGVPDPREKGQLLYDQSMCERVYGVLQDLITAGSYAPQAPVTLDAPEEEGAPATGSTSAATPSGGGTSSATPAAATSASSAAGPALSPEATAELSTMISGGGRLLEVWIEGKTTRKARAMVYPDRTIVTVAFEDGRKEAAQFAASAIRGVLLNVPVGTKKKTGLLSGMSRQPKAERAITLEDKDGNTIFHFEVEKEAARAAVAHAFANISGVTARSS